MNRDPSYGRLLANRYQLAELVGEGAMGRVYRAKDTVLGGVVVAIKFLSQALLNQNMRDRFEKEATISALLGEKSNHVVRVKDYGVDENNIPFYVMEYLSGESLSDIIRYQPLSLSRFLILTRHICLGLESAHQGIPFSGELCRIIHRDIKPSNIIVIQDPTVGELAKILDFGIAKLILANASQTQSFMGTLAYCSPEQMKGQQLDNRSDIYSLGIMMYEMLTTDMPVMPQNSSFGGWYQAHNEFQPEPFKSHLGLPNALQNLVMACLAKAKEDRPQSIRNILQELEELNQTPKVPATTQSSQVENPPSTQKVNSGQEQTVKGTPSLTEICLQHAWPKDKPVKKIVFAQVLQSPLGEIPVLSVMLDKTDIVNRMSSIRYNQFLFLNYPHPMLLWITLLYTKKHGPRWLPCYLDLKSHKGQQLSRALASLGSYRILFFALDHPERCQHVSTSNIDPQNANMLEKWAGIGKSSKTSGYPQASKEILKGELEQLKPKILLKLEAVETNFSGDFSG
ncbi:serine/threonine-protein kinase [Xenococcus sp. PCC 7305]|uniref:serine/threonine-protein kinase n=1 Tax=Xenococcus sp. PCC 7305 TaxID=102125 RepID=UPI000301C1A7|nr:serine/threonine-protein kinase [Xenococcus sp. PCC 7305]